MAAALELSMATEKIVVEETQKGFRTTRGQITTGAEARQARQEQTDHFIHVADRFLQRNQLPCFSAMRSRISSDFAR